MEYDKLDSVVCQPYPIVAGTYERRWHFGALLRANHPVRGKSHRYASHNLVVIVILAVAVALFLVVTCSRAGTFSSLARSSSSSSSSARSYHHPAHGPLLFTDR